jgi:hypothetical protein
MLWTAADRTTLGPPQFGATSKGRNEGLTMISKIRGMTRLTASAAALGLAVSLSACSSSATPSTTTARSSSANSVVAQPGS